ncbi:MAG: hypothetical protein PVH15_12970, partial [Syntrophobacterales bacterium]
DINKVSGFSDPALASRVPAGQVVFPAAALHQEVSGLTSYFFLKPETFNPDTRYLTNTRHLKPYPYSNHTD